MLAASGNRDASQYAVAGDGLVTEYVATRLMRGIELCIGVNVSEDVRALC